MARIADDAAAIAARVKELEAERAEARRRSEETGGAGGTPTGGAGDRPNPTANSPKPEHYDPGHYNPYGDD